MDIIIIFYLIVLLFSVIIHELAHGYVAYALGDSTAKYAGRLTINPIKHLDIFGSILLPLLLFLSSSPALIGWAKPVPINPYNFKDQKWGSLKVAVAGPLSNIVLALLFGLAIRLASANPALSLITLKDFFGIIVLVNLGLAIFNLIPIPPLDGHWILFSFLPRGFDGVKLFLQQYGIFILIFLIFFGGLGWLYALESLLFSLFTGIGS